MTPQIEEKIKELLLSLHYTIDGDYTIDEESMGNQLREVFLSIRRETLEEAIEAMGVDMAQDSTVDIYASGYNDHRQESLNRLKEMREK